MLTPRPHAIYHSGKIYTVNPTQPWAEAVAVADGHILAVGENAEILALAGIDTHLVNLGGRLTLPGLCDAHIHFYNWSITRQEVELAATRSKAEMMARIAERAATTPPGGWIVGNGWNESRWGETRFPDRHDLDVVTGPDRPAIFWRSDMHGAVANSAALALAGVTGSTPNPAGGVIDMDSAGQPTGFLRELAIGLVAFHIPAISSAALDAALAGGMAELHRLGITALHDQRMKDHDDGPLALAAYQRLRREGRLKLRINRNIAAHDLPHLAGLGLATGLGDDTLRLGHVKVFTDGSMGTRTAWMLASFEKESPDDPDNLGVSVTPPAQMAAEFRRPTELGFPISVHAIGDQANRVVLDIFEELAATGMTPATPHRMEHVQIIDPTDLPRLAQLGITASVQPIHATDDMDTADLLLGARTAHMYNFRSLLASGALLALGSDAPVADPNPFLGFHAALVRQRPERAERPAWHGAERIGLKETILGYTKNAAQAGGWADTIGSLEAGKRADMIVLDRDLFELTRQGFQGREVADTQVAMTIFDGEIVYEANGKWQMAKP